MEVMWMKGQIACITPYQAVEKFVLCSLRTLYQIQIWDASTDLAIFL